MDTNFLPNIINPWNLAEAEQTLEATVALMQMPRLVEFLENQLGEAKFILKFIKDETTCVVIHGKITAALPLLCQRCMQPMSYFIDTEFRLSPVLTEAETTNLPAQYEHLITYGRAVSVIEDIIEEELLLCLPLVPRHPQAQCSSKLPKTEVLAELKKTYPLTELIKLKQKLKTED